MIHVYELQNLNQREQHTLVFELIKRAERGWLNATLRKLEISGRTKIYKVFNYYNSYWGSLEKRDGRNQDQHEAVDTILELSNTDAWVDSFLEWYTIKALQDILQKTSFTEFSSRVNGEFHIEVRNQ